MKDRLLRVIYLGRNQEVAQNIDRALRKRYQNHDRQSEVEVELVHVTSQKKANDEIRSAPPHGVLVEISNGRFNRRRFCQMIRTRLPLTQLIAVQPSAQSNDLDPAQLEKFDGLIAQPFSLSQAKKSLDSLVNGGDEMYLQVGELNLDVAMSQVSGPKGEHHLAPKLCRLLQILMENVGKTVSRERLMQDVWQTEFIEDTRTLDVHIRWLRERIEVDPSRPRYLFTVRGQGYRIEEPSPR